MKKGLKRAIEVLDRMNREGQEKMRLMPSDSPDRKHWESYCGALTTAALMLEKELKA